MYTRGFFADLNALHDAIFYKAYKLLYTDLNVFLRGNASIIEVLKDRGLESLTWELVQQNTGNRVRFLREYTNSLSSRPSSETEHNFKDRLPFNF